MPRGVKCVWRNSICTGINGPCRYGSLERAARRSPCRATCSSTASARRSSSRRTDHELLQNELRNFGFGADTGIDLPYEFDGRMPDDELQGGPRRERGARRRRGPALLLGDVINMAIGQGLLAATPMQLAVGYSALANGGYVMRPRVVEAIFAPEHADAPDAARVRRPHPCRRARDASRRPAEHDARWTSPSRSSTASARTSPAPAQRPNSTTAEELFDVSYPSRRHRRSPARPGTAQGVRSLPVERLVGVRAPSATTAARPYTVVAYLEKSGFGSQGAAPVVKCMFLALCPA